MSVLGLIRAKLPRPVKRVLRPLFDLSQRMVSKHASELSYWESRFAAEGNRFDNHWYRTNMLAMAGERDDSFLAGKIVADFGCGPRGSLTWASRAAIRLGIDVLAERYLQRFGDCLTEHGMVYVTSTERIIPLPSAFVDVMFTINALDHADDFEATCREILRVVAPGGEVVGSFNLGEAPTRTEPQMLDESRIRVGLLDHLEVTSYRVAPQGPPMDPYAHLFRDDVRYREGEPGYLWVRARKPAHPAT